jgi:hypothetical protein
MTQFSNIEKVRELKLELEHREKVFRRLVADGRMTPEVRDRRMAILREIAADYIRLAALNEQPTGE